MPNLVTPPGHGPAKSVAFIKSYSTAEIADSYANRAEFGDVPARDSRGRFGYATGFTLFFTYQVDVNATTLAAAYAGERNYGLLENFRMQALGEELFIGGWDGRRFNTDDRIRNGGAPSNPEPADIADSNATDSTANVTLVHSFVEQDDNLYGAIPLVCLDHRRRPTDVLQWVNETDLADGAVAGITYDGLTALECHLHTFYHERPVIDARPVIREETFADLQGTIEPAALGVDTRMQYCILRYTHGDTNGLTASDVENWTVRHGNDVYAEGRTAEEMGRMWRALTNRAETQADEPATFTPGVEVVPLMPNYPHARRSEWGRAPLHFRVGSNGSQDLLRILHRQFVPWTAEQQAEIARRWGIPVGQVQRGVRGARDIDPELVPKTLTRKNTK